MNSRPTPIGVGQEIDKLFDNMLLLKCLYPFSSEPIDVRQCNVTYRI